MDGYEFSDYGAPEDNSTAPQTGNGEVRIGMHYYPVLGGNLSPLNLARWPSKVTTGDYSLDSDPLMSSYIVSSLTGGVGNLEIKPGVDDQTYWTGTLETRYPEGPTLLPLTERFELDPDNPADAAFPLGDYYYGGNTPYFLAAFDTALATWDESTKTWTDTMATLSGPPLAHGVNWNGNFYVPLGANGYDVVDSLLTVTNETDFEPIHMLVWDKKLCAINADGEFVYQVVGGTGWSTPDADTTIPSGQRARRLVNFINNSGIPTIYVVTNSTMYAFNPDGGSTGELYETRLDYPKHPDQGRAAVNWRGDAVYVNVGLGIHSYDGNIVASMGPDGRYGLPAHLRGTIVDLAAEYNHLIALIQGVPNEAVSQPDEEYFTQAPMYRNQDTWQISNFPYAPVYSSIYRYANGQWHPAWESDDAEGFPTWMAISEAGGYRLWWGYGQYMYTQELPVAFQNPKQSLLSGGRPFAPSGHLITGWFDADMKPFDKLASHVEVNLDYVSQDISNQSAGGTVRISFQMDDDPEEAWRTLGEANTVGMTVMPFRNASRQEGNPFSRGRVFNRIRFKIEYEQEAGNVYTSPLMYSMVFKFQKIPETQLSWSFTIPLEDPDGYKGVGNDTLYQYLNDLLVGDEFFEFGALNNIYRSRLIQVGGQGYTGYDNRYNLQVNLLSVNTGTMRRSSTRITYADTDHG